MLKFWPARTAGYGHTIYADFSINCIYLRTSRRFLKFLVKNRPIFDKNFYFLGGQSGVQNCTDFQHSWKCRFFHKFCENSTAVLSFQRTFGTGRDVCFWSSAELHIATRAPKSRRQSEVAKG